MIYSIENAFGEEPANPVDSVVGQVGSHVGQHDQPDPCRVARTPDQCSLPAARSADQRHAPRELRKQDLHVACKRLDMIISICRPSAFAMAAQIESDAVKASFANLLGRATPGVTALSAAMKKEDGRSLRVAEGYPGKLQSVPSVADSLTAQIRP